MKFATLFAAMFLVAMPGLAADRGLEVAGWYVWMQPTADGTFNAGTPVEPFDVNFTTDSGYGVSANMFLGSRFSVELAVSQVKTSIELEARGREANLPSRSTTVMPITGTLQFHFAPDAMIDPYLGVGAAYTIIGSVDDTTATPLSVDDVESGGVGYLVNAGLSVELTEQFGLLLDAKYVPSGSEGVGTLNDAAGTQADVKVSPIIVSLGFSYRF